MTNEEAKEILAIYRFNLIQSMSNQLEGDIEALDIAIQALETASCIKEKCAYCPHCEHCDVDDETLEIKALEQQPCEKCEVGNPCLYCEYDFTEKKTKEPCEDCISREQAIRATYGFERYTEIDEAPYEYAESILRDLPSVTPKERWIPVSEKLPEDGRTVLVWFEYYRYGDYNRLFQTFGLSYAYGGHWSEFVNGESGWKDLRIIAWMPLPQPFEPQESESEDKE